MSNTKASLTQQNTQTYPSNTSGSITALSVKSFNNNFINAVATLGDTNVFTEPQTFGNTVQVNSDVIANNFIGPLIGTASWAIQALTASFAVNTNINTGSLLVTASSALNTITFTKGDNTTFNVTVNTGSATSVNTGSLLVTASVSNDIITFTKGNNTTFDITVNNVKNSSTSSVISVGGDNTNANRKIVFVGTTGASISEQLLIAANAPDLSYNPTTNVINATASFANNATTASHALNVPSTGSLLTTASVSLNTITFTKGDASTFAITVDTGSGGGGGSVDTGSFATTGSNVFSGSQTFNTASIFLNASGSGPLFTNFTQSVVGAGGLGGAFGNIFLIPTSINSGSVILSGSRNIGTLNPNTNAGSLTSRGGGNLNGNFGIFNTSYTTASSPIVLNNNFLGGAVQNAIPNTSSVTTLTGNFVGGIIITTGSATSNVNILTNNIDAAIITNNFTGSGANQAVSVVSNLIKGGTSQPNFAQIKFAATQSNGNSRTFTNNIMFGPANVASLEASGAVSATSNLVNTAIIGSNLVVSGTMANNSTSAAMFVGQFNETGSFADPSQIKFAVGAGTNTTTRSTPLYVSASGDVIMRLPGQTANSIFKGDIVDINGRWNGSTNTLANNATAIASTQVNMTQSIGSAVIATQAVSVGGVGLTVTGSAAIADFSGDLGGTSWVASIGNFDSSIRGTQQGLVAATSASFMSSSVNSAIIAGGNVRLNNGNSTVALGRDTAYTASAAYTLFTQNVNLSGSLTVNGNVQYNYGSFYNTASITLTANTSQSLAFTTIDEVSGFTLSGSNNEQIKATNAGTYNLQFSAQLDQGANSANYFIWLKKNGSNVANTAGKSTLASNHSMISAWNYVVSLAANDTLELVIQSDANNSSVAYIAASGNIPAAPSIIATITQVK